MPKEERVQERLWVGAEQKSLQLLYSFIILPQAVVDLLLLSEFIDSDEGGRRSPKDLICPRHYSKICWTVMFGDGGRAQSSLRIL